MSNSQQLSLAETSSNNISLGDFARLICASWRQILAVLAATLLVAGFYLAATPKQYVATLTVSLGQVGILNGVRQIEEDSDVVTRMRSAEFQNAVAESLGWRGDEREKLLKSSFKISNPSSKQVKIQLRGFSSEEAIKAANESLAVLSRIHNQYSERISAVRERDLSMVRSDIAESELHLRNLKVLGQRGKSSETQLSIIIILMAIKNESMMLRNLYAKEEHLKEAMSPELNKPTMALDAVFVPDSPIVANVRRVLVFAALTGLLIGILLVSIRTLIHINRNAVSSVS